MKQQLFSFLLFCLPAVWCTVLWNGNFNEYSVSTDLDNWSFANPVGQWETYIYGNANSSFKMSTYVQLSTSNKNPADTVSKQGIRVEINSNSHWNGQPMLRTELIGQFNEQTIQTGTIYYKWSMMQGNTNQLLSTDEHQLVFFEAHFADIKFGGQGGANLQFWTNGQMTWSQAFTPGVWFNFGLQVDYNGKTVALWYSQAGNTLQQVVAPVAVSTSSSDFHVGSLRLPDNNNVQSPNVEWIYYSGVQIVDSVADIQFGTGTFTSPAQGTTNSPSTSHAPTTANGNPSTANGNPSTANGNPSSAQGNPSIQSSNAFPSVTFNFGTGTNPVNGVNYCLPSLATTLMLVVLLLL